MGKPAPKRISKTMLETPMRIMSWPRGSEVSKLCSSTIQWKILSIASVFTLQPSSSNAVFD